jgi:2-succinyl-5-enolpyruvyl-6-hydroxy-3-cyclohexene-1-carboxylate synthase
VHLNLPLREPLTPSDDGTGFPYPLDGRPDGAPWTSAAVAGPDAALPADAGELVSGARRGVVVAGDGLTAADADTVVAFAAARQWPLVAEPHSNARRGPCALTAIDAVLQGEAFTPDLVVVAGRVGLSRALLAFLARSRCVVLDRHGRWPDPTRTAAYVVPVAAAGLRDAGGAAADPDWLGGWLGAACAASEAIDAVLDQSPDLTEPLVARDVAANVTAGTALVVASSMPIRDLDLTMRPRDDIQIFANRGVSGIDGFVSTAAGIALAHNENTVALAGDLSLLHDVNGLLIRDGHPLGLTLVVVNNDGGGIFSLLPQAEAGDRATFDRIFGTPHGADLAAIVTAYGGMHARIGDIDELRTAIAAPADGIRVLEVRTDRGANAELHRRLAAEASAAVARYLSSR